jgi:molybdopterin molybdotransferase
MLSVSRATSKVVESAIRARASRFNGQADETVPLSEAVDHFINIDVFLDRDAPPFDRVAMDGIAVGSVALRDGVRTFKIIGIQPAGVPAQLLHEPCQCIEVMTGAVLPLGADAVIPYEECTIDSGIAALNGRFDASMVAPGHNVHRHGVDASVGTQLIPRGTRLGPTHIAILASTGMSTVTVQRAPRIGFISSGDELVPVTATPLPHQIRQSNNHAIAAALALAGFREMQWRHANDDFANLHAAVSESLDRDDVCLISGGVSAGRFDLVPEVLRSLGVREVFHKVAQRPGKPLWFGEGPTGQLVFGLPGNPVSSLVCTYRYVLPALQCLVTGVPTPLPPSEAVASGIEFSHRTITTLFAPVKKSQTGVEPISHHGSGDFVSLLDSDGFIELDLGKGPFTAGIRAPYYPWVQR